MKTFSFATFLTLSFSVAVSAQDEIRLVHPVVGHLMRVNRAFTECGIARRIAIASSRQAVEDLLGPPDACVGERYWIYWNCGVTPADVNPRGYDALLIRFEANQIAEMKAVDSATLRAVVRSKSIRRAR